MEAQMGIEPMHRGFADRSVTTSPLRHCFKEAALILINNSQDINSQINKTLSIYREGFEF